MRPNALLQFALPVPFHAIEASDIEPAVDALLEAAESAIDAVATAERTYRATLGVLDMASETLDWAVGVAAHLESVMGTPEIRAAYGAILPKLISFSSRIILSEPLFRALREFGQSEEAQRLDGAHARLLSKTLADYRRSGAALATADKERLAGIDAKLSELTLAFSQNVVDATAAFEHLVDDPARLSGLPDAVIEAARASAAERGRDGWRFTLQAPSYGPVMTFADDRGLREVLYRAYFTRAAQGAWDNWPHAREILRLRHEKAQLLGFAHFADLTLDDRMLRSGREALAFADMLREKLSPAFERERAELCAFARAEGQASELAGWDVGYWSERQRRARYDFDEETLRPYFPLDRVLRGMFDIAHRLYGLTVERDPTLPMWHPDAVGYAAIGPSGARIGTFYLDLHPRETKRDGAWMAGLADRLGGAPARENVAVVVASMTRPSAPGRPALLTHREVETLFHEFGHLLHHLLSDVPIRTLSGTRVVADFVELPSMIMENWTWEREALDHFARHVDTGDPIPETIKERMLRARNYRAASMLMVQVGYATLDLRLHTMAELPSDLPRFAREAFAPFTTAPLPAEYAMVASFGHLFGAPVGYAAGYYAYQWARVLESDAFDRFAREGVLSRSAGQAFADGILSRGDTADPSLLFRQFVGRDPDPSTLLKRLGPST